MSNPLPPSYLSNDDGDDVREEDSSPPDVERFINNGNNSESNESLKF